MSYTIADIKNDITRKLHGTSLNNVSGILNVISEGARKVIADSDLKSLKRFQNITGGLFGGVYKYLLPSDVSGNKIIDIRPQVNRTRADNFIQRTDPTFDQYKANNTFSVEYDSGNRFLLVSKDITPYTVVNYADSVSNNGTWTAGDDSSNVRKDSINYVTGSGSVRFDVSGATTTASLTNDDMDSVDLTDYDGDGSLFVWVYMPSVITSATLRWGSSSSAYWEDSATTPHTTTSFIEGWNLIEFKWSEATTTGSPDVTAVNYLKIVLTYDGNASENYRINGFYARLSQIWEIEYYSKYLFQNSSGTWIEKPTDDNDIINAEQEEYDLLLSKIMEILAQQIQGSDSGFDTTYFINDYKMLQADYVRTFKSEVKRPITTYYPNYEKRQRYAGRYYSNDGYNQFQA